MIQQYLLQDLTEKEKIIGYSPNGIQKRLFSADDERCWYVQFSVKGENEDVARKLSEVDEYVCREFHVTILENGCSAYFNRRLFPLISEFEYKLRKLLYLTSAINSNEESSSNISDLEAKDFGQIFTLLFIDTSFMEKVKEEVKNRNRDTFTKDNVIAKIASIEESTLWDSLLGSDSVPTLRKRFNDARKYRNDVMHAQRMSWKRFREICVLYKLINEELENALNSISITESSLSKKPSFNETLAAALRAQEHIISMTKAVMSSVERIQQLSEWHALTDALIQMQNQAKAISTLPLSVQPISQQMRDFTLNATEPRLKTPPSLSDVQKNRP